MSLNQQPRLTHVTFASAVIIATLTGFNTQAQAATTYCVATNGNDSNPGTCSQPWRTINHAVSDKSPVKAGDNIQVQPGTYTELITLGKSGSQGGQITLKANGKVILRDPSPTSGGFREGVIQAAGKSNWTIDGFRIEKTSWAGISLRDAKNMIVQNNQTYETGSSGIIVLPDTYYQGGEQEVTSSNIKVLNNTIERANWSWKTSTDSGSTQESLSIWGVNGFEVAGNTLKEGKREGIDIKVGSRNGTVYNNKVSGQALVSGTPQGYNGGPGIYLDGNRAAMSNIDVYNNVVYGNTAEGIAIADEVPAQGDVSNIRVYNNIIYGNGKQGVNGGAAIALGSNVRDVQILHNTCFGNVQCFNIDGTPSGGSFKTRNVLMRNNIFANSTYRHGAIKDADNVTIDNNTFSTGFAKLYETIGAVGNLKDNKNTTFPSFGFVNQQSNDFHITSSSPIAKAGSPDIPEFARKDKDGVSRPQGTNPATGAYQSK